ncbi:MAG TPA: nickel pincer cofactor biosynthesis protein LarB [Sorangium sp.]|nr:nickel pincer cofactor biosynthesis protein LarB [Sorangium sp.]
MKPERLRALLEGVGRGEISVTEASRTLSKLPYQDIGVATVDHHRALRQGCPEVVYGEGKTSDQLLRIASALLDAGQNVLVTRADGDKAAALCAAHASARHAPLARTVSVELTPPPLRPCAPVAVMCAGSSDIPVAEEALETLRALGLSSRRIVDVGVAGLHRLLGRSEELLECSCIIVIAGMEGALPSVVGGLVRCPVIAVPTSVGYGAAFGGLAALLGMLNSCAAGVTVVNIDNGFGAAMAAHRMLPSVEVP